MQQLIAENEAVVSLVDTTAQLIGEPETRLVEAGTTGTVVAIHRQGSHIAAYEVEFHLGGNSWGLATIPMGEVDRPSQGKAVPRRSLAASSQFNRSSSRRLRRES